MTRNGFRETNRYILYSSSHFHIPIHFITILFYKCPFNDDYTIFIDYHKTRPYIRNGFPKNVTAMENTTVTFQCPTIDPNASILWAKYQAFNDSDGSFMANTTTFKV